MELGKTICARRKERGLTQEKLAALVGVSASAVSKWENDATYPDIALLPPIARALGCTVDTLLSFQPELSQDKIDILKKELQLVYKEEGYERGSAHGEALLREYPNNAHLKMIVCGLAQQMMMLKTDLDERSAQHILHRCIDLLADISNGNDTEFALPAKVMLASYHMALGEYARAEEMIRCLPEVAIEPQAMRATLCLLQGNTADAQTHYQRNVYRHALLCMNALSGLASVEIKKEQPENALNRMRQYIALAELMGIRDIAGYESISRLYMQLGKQEEALQSFLQYMEHVCTMERGYVAGPMQDAGPHVDAENATMLKAAILHILQQEPERYGIIAQDPRFLNAVETLRQSLSI